MALSYAQLQKQRDGLAPVRHPARVPSAKQPFRKRFQQPKICIQQPKPTIYLLEPQLAHIKQTNNLQFLRHIHTEQTLQTSPHVKRQQAAQNKQQRQCKEQLSVNSVPRSVTPRRQKIAKPFKPASEKDEYEPPSLLDLEESKNNSK